LYAMGVMKHTMDNKELITHLKSQKKDNAEFIDSLKIAYRPLICPFEDLLPLIPKQSSVFDVGCGSGMFLSLVQHFRNPSKMGGIEISQQLIANANDVLNADEHPHITLATFDGINIPATISDFQYICMIDVFHHIPPRQQNEFLIQLFKKMGKGSFLIFKDIDGSSLLSYWNKFHDLLLSGDMGNEPTIPALKELIHDDAKMVIKQFYKRRMFLYPHFTLVLQKKG